MEEYRRYQHERRRKRRKQRKSLVRRLLAVVSAMIVAAMIYGVPGDDDDDDDDNDRYSYKFHVIPRERTTIAHIRQQLSDYHFRRAYRMTYEQFKDLVSLLSPILEQRRSSTDTRRKVINGVISDDLRVSICLRFLAGGSVYDIALVHGVAPQTVYSIVGQVLEAIMNCPALQISFPTDHEEQARIAEGFRAVSTASFDCCVGAIDGILIWIEKPSESSCESWNHLQSGAFFCGRKSKFGFNMQAIADAKGRFIAVWIITPASASDYISFTTSPLHRMLSRPGFLKEGYALFGDNAYVSNEFMATPYKGAKRGPKDDYNFFHSQVRIHIEMAFGMLTRRWGILRKPLSSSLKFKKQLRIAMVCCMLHNFCIGESEEVPPLSDRDEFQVQSEGHMYAVGEDGNRNFADHLMGGGEHFDDIDVNETRQRRRDRIRRKLRLRVEELDIHRPKLH